MQADGGVVLLCLLHQPAQIPHRVVAARAAEEGVDHAPVRELVIVSQGIPAHQIDKLGNSQGEGIHQFDALQRLIKAEHHVAFGTVIQVLIGQHHLHRQDLVIPPYIRTLRPQPVTVPGLLRLLHRMIDDAVDTFPRLVHFHRITLLFLVV